MKKILMCFPHCFDVNYEINPWMNSNVGKVNNELAKTQWINLENILKQYTNLLVMKNQPKELPDLVFTANAALTINNNALLSKFACIEREDESILYKNFLNENKINVDTFFVENKINFEGAGDALLEKNKNTLILGYGFRTDKIAINYVESWLKKVSPKTTILHAELINPNFYHLDTCCCPLDNGYVMYYPLAFSEETNKQFKEIFNDKIIEVSLEDAKMFGCNAVSINDKLIVNDITLDLEKKLKKIGIETIKTPMNEFMLSGGSVKCLTLELSLKV